MAEKRKFAALAELHRQPLEEQESPVPTQPVTTPSAALPDEGRARGRPATGKRSNPEWKLYSHFLKRKTQREAAARLQAEDSGRDLSDVLQELLERWLET